MDKQCQQEIIDLHQFFMAWLGGSLPNGEGQFARVSHVLGESFAIINPDGRLILRQPLLAGLRQAHGTRPQLQIWIENFALHYEAQGLAICTYEEWQATEGQTTVRLSTAVFRQQTNTPNGVVWLHVHETWRS